MTEPLARLFERVEGQTLPAPDLAGVHRRARRIRHRRVLGAAGVTACAVALTVGAVQLLGPVTSRTGTPATRSEHHGRSGDGLLLPGDLGPGGWVNRDPGGRAEIQSAALPACVSGPPTKGMVTAPGTTGLSSTWSRGPAGNSDWYLTEKILRIGADAEALAAELRTLASCTYTTAGPVLAGSDTVLVVGQRSPSGVLNFATAYAWSGGRLITLQIWPASSPDRSTEIPGGAAWLARLVATATERTTGVVTPPPAVRPGATAPVVVDPPKGYLAVADLGTTGNWRIDPGSPDDRRTSPATSLELPSCTAGRPKVTAPGGSQVYRGTTQGGSGEWYLSETVVTLTPAQASAARAAFTRAGRCSGVSTGLGQARRESSGTDRLVLGIPLDDGRTGFAQAWALTGDTLIQLETLPGGAVGGAALPGGAPWLASLLQTAVERA